MKTKRRNPTEVMKLFEQHGFLVSPAGRKLHLVHNCPGLANLRHPNKLNKFKICEHCMTISYKNELIDPVVELAKEETTESSDDFMNAAA